MTISTDAKLFYGFLTEEGGFDHGVCEPLLAERYPELVDAEEATGCTVVYHCSAKCTRYAVAIAHSVHVAHRGHPLTVSAMAPYPGGETMLQEFCRRFRLTYAAPAWWLASYAD